MSALPLLLLLGLVTSTSGGWAFNEDSDTNLSIEPMGEGGNHSVYLVRAGEKFMVHCVYRPSDSTAANTHSLQWVNEVGSPIESSISVFTQAKREGGGVRRSLIFPKIKAHDSGQYKCRGEMDPDGGFVQKTIHIVVRDNVAWNTAGDRVGGVLGDPLTIDCGISGGGGGEETVIEITDDRGQALSGEVFSVSNDQATIPKLAKEHQGLKVRCLAVQKVGVPNEFNTTASDLHELVVDVWYAPEFEYKEVEKYAIAGQNISLPCIVSDSHPQVEHFSFFKDNVVIFGHEKFMVNTALESQMAVMSIDRVGEDDFGRYKCVANTGKLRGEQFIVLHKTRPPKPPRVSVESSTNTSITWRISSDGGDREAGDLPVLSYSIDYAPSTSPQATTSSGGGGKTGTRSLPRDSKAERMGITRQRTGANLYTIEGLKPYVEYEFLFSGRNEAGVGDPSLVRATTGQQLKLISTSGTGVESVRVGSAIIMMAICLFLIY